MTEFLTHSTNIVKNFLQTAVFLDDRAEMACTSRKEVTPSLIHDPNMGEMVAAKQTKDTEDSEAHRLEAETIIDTFMQNGIVCSVLRCKKDDKVSQKNNYITLMKKADLIVLDWDMHNDGGEYTTEIIQSLLSETYQIKPFRSIIIYTAESLDAVKPKLERDAKVLFDSDASFRSTENQYTHVSLYNKPVKLKTHERSVDFSELIDKCISEFTTSFHGIVPNVAMAAIAEIRAKTHNLLGVLNKELDLAYLSHRALLPYPEDAETHLEEIIIHEIASIIHEAEVGQLAQFSTLKTYPNINDKKFNQTDFITFLDPNSDPDIKKKISSSSAKKLFTYQWDKCEQNIAEQSEISFAKLTSLETEYTNNEKNLTLGIVIKAAQQELYFLCLQPPCDSTRLTTAIDFTFIELIEATNEKPTFHIILNDKKYRIDYKKEYRKYIKFDSTGITSKNKNFTDCDGTNYTFVAKLKQLQAQRILNEYSAYISRVGLNESEYLRRNRP